VPKPGSVAAMTKTYSRVEWTIHLADYLDNFTSDQRFSTSLDTANHTRDRVTDLAMHWYESINDHDLAVGIDSSLMKLKTDRLVKDRVERVRYGAFLQDQWRLHPDVILTPGLRFDHDSQFDKILAKKFGLRWHISPQTEVRWSYSEGYRAPDFKELYLSFNNPSVGYQVTGNEDLEAEMSKNYSSQLIWIPNQTWRLQSHLYHNEFRNLIAVQTLEPASIDQANRYSYGNIATAEIQGVESSVDRRWSAWFHTVLSHNFLHARNLCINRWLENRPQHAGKLQSSFQFLNPDMTLNIIANPPLVGGCELNGIRSGRRKVV
jgi:outer membrane receptor for ferrienterochelin and colicins